MSNSVTHDTDTMVLVDMLIRNKVAKADRKRVEAIIVSQISRLISHFDDSYLLSVKAFYETMFEAAKQRKVKMEFLDLRCKDAKRLEINKIRRRNERRIQKITELERHLVVVNLAEEISLYRSAQQTYKASILRRIDQLKANVLSKTDLKVKVQEACTNVEALFNFHKKRAGMFAFYRHMMPHAMFSKWAKMERFKVHVLGASNMDPETASVPWMTLVRSIRTRLSSERDTASLQQYINDQ